MGGRKCSDGSYIEDVETPGFGDWIQELKEDRKGKCCPLFKEKPAVGGEGDEGRVKWQRGAPVAVVPDR